MSVLSADDRLPVSVAAAALWLVVGTALFAFIYTIPKTAALAPSVAWIVFFRYFGGFVTLLPFALRTRMTSGPLRQSSLYGHLARAGAGLGAAFAMFYAVTSIPVADAVAISMTEGAICLILAALFLGEAVGLRRWISVIVAMTGGLIVANPSGESLSVSLVSPGAMAAAIAAIFIALEAIVYRYLAKREKPLTIVLYLSGLSSLIALPVALWTGHPGDVLDFWPVLLMGPLAALAQLCNVRAYRAAEASFLQPFAYFSLPLAGLFAFAMFGEVPSLTTWIGGCVVLLGAYLALGGGRSRNRIGIRR